MISIPFTFRNQQYQSLIHLVEKDGHRDLRVTIMNGELEKALTGKNTFPFINGYLIADLVTEEGIQRELQTEILLRLDEYFLGHRSFD